MEAANFGAIVLQRNQYDVYTAAALEAELAPLTPQMNIVDCARVLSLDCAALGALVRVLNRLRASDAAVTLRLVNVHTRLGRLFEMTSLNSVFDIAFQD